MIADIINRTDLHMIPLNKNRIDGMTESANARNILFFLKHTIQMMQYRTTSITSTIR